MPKKNRIKIENIGRLMVYILGHRPYEFGLVPDTEGFVTYKELVWAIHEEPGWGYVRQGNINEILSGKDRALFQSEGNRIRAVDKRWKLDLDRPAQSLPKILFTGIRRKAHPVVLEKGLRLIEGECHVLSPGRKMAERIGKRRDQEPVLVEVMSGTALKEGVVFYPFGDLFLAREVPARYIAGPPVPKDFIKAREEKAKEKLEPFPAFQAGTFVLDINRDMDRSRKAGGRKKKGWKEETRRHRKRNRIKS
ncbi:RNA 2'-phosphotransferase [Thermodesulfobacteriota bacterium]